MRLSGDPKNPKVCVKVLTFTGGCVTTGTCPTTGITYQTGYTITEYCSSNQIFDYCESLNSDYTTKEHWILVDCVWERSTYFDTVLRTGSGGATYSTTVNMANGALLWDKPRNQASSHFLFDSVRGIANRFSSNLTNAETSSPTWYTNFGNGSYTTGADDWGSPTTLVDWIWAAGTGTTNTAGSITSTVGANTTSGFSVVTYTGTGSDATVGHGLGVAPSMIIGKARNSALAWRVYHTSIGAANFLALNTTDASASGATWNSTTPTSTVFTVGGGSNMNVDSSTTYVAYCFAPIAGYSAFGSFVGNGSADGALGSSYSYSTATALQANAWLIFNDALATSTPQNFPSVADANAPNSTLYYSTTASKLVWKDSAGAVNNLY